MLQLIVDWTAYQLPGLFNEFLGFIGVKGSGSAVFIKKTIDCMSEQFACHLKDNSMHKSLKQWLNMPNSSDMTGLYERNEDN